MSDPDADAKRLEKMLDVALQALRDGDGDTVLMALAEAEKVVDGLPKKAEPPDIILLPGP